MRCKRGPLLVSVVPDCLMGVLVGAWNDNTEDEKNDLRRLFQTLILKINNKRLKH